MAEVPDSILTKGNILLRAFCFHIEKPLMTILPILCAYENPYPRLSNILCTSSRGFNFAELNGTQICKTPEIIRQAFLLSPNRNLNIK